MAAWFAFSIDPVTVSGRNGLEEIAPPVAAPLPEIVLPVIAPPAHTPPPSAPPAELLVIVLPAICVGPNEEMPPPSIPRLPDTLLSSTVSTRPAGAAPRSRQRWPRHGGPGGAAANPARRGCPFCPLKMPPPSSLAETLLLIVLETTSTEPG